MATIACPCPAPLSELQDWYRSQPNETASERGYEVKRRLRQRHVKHSYLQRAVETRRRRIYEQTMAILLADTSVVADAVVIPHAQSAAEMMEQKFRAHADKWDRETTYLSSTPTMVLHDSYQKIIAMGPDVVPLLLRDLQKSRRSWFWALRHLTNANPVPQKDQGNLDKMIEAWIAWGKREGRI